MRVINVAIMFRRDLPAGAILTEDAMVFDLPANSSDVIVR